MRALPALLLTLLAACAGDPAAAPTDPADNGRPDLTSQAFRVTLDLARGQVGVRSPAAAAASSADGLRPSLSLIGDEGVQVFARNLSCVPIPKNREQKRCSFDLQLSNQLDFTDLMTPTTFPKPPAGVDGVLVVPLSATATGGRGPVTPSPDWDGSPVNFFNDFGSCPGGSKSDCQRYETIPSPFYAGTGSPTRRVGYDVPVGAQGVTAYVVVAADLRENPVRTFRSPPILDRCGMVAQTRSGDIELRMLLGSTFGETFRGFCTFNGLPSNVIIRNAVLHMYKDDGVAGDAGVEYLDYGETVDFEDYGLPATNDWHQLNTAGRNLYTVNLTAEVQAAYAAGAENFPFRFRMRNEEDTWASYAGWINIFPSPALELTYTMK